ncbi:hypothetical protein E9232_001124 [Inquilinus ginsengisoli]|uniref:Uncharacterized protein n=1 Tax=Inquilinus ginsengisoli TaxID=363840 RepID=A0ABU1JJ32_9PROT|nr:hypothetical protein [Inquilinus ginsengisoli]MDR6288617.1 hypothetical protein [Inquilinus ginsengisoli]
MIPVSNPGQAEVYYKGAVEQAARYEHAGDLERRAEVLGWIADFKVRWSAAGYGPLDGTSGWPITPQQFAAKKRDLESEVTKARMRGGEFWHAPQADLDAHVELGTGLGYSA